MDLRTNGTETVPARSRKWARIGDAWLEASIQRSTEKSDLFDLALSLRAADGPIATPAFQERFTRVSLEASHPRYAPKVLAGSEIARLVGLLAAGDAPPAPPADDHRPRVRSRRLPRPLAVRPQRIAGAFALLALLFPAVVFIPAVAHADGGGGGVTGGPVVTTSTTPTRDPGVTTPTDTTPTDTTPTDTTTTDTTPTDTTPTDTTTDPTSTEPTTTDGLPPTKIPDNQNYRPSSDTPVTTVTVPVQATTNVDKPERPKVTPKAKPKTVAKPVKKAAAPVVDTTKIPGKLLDPTPPALRLNAAFAQNLTAVSTNAHVDWALLLALIRAQGGISSAPVSEPALEKLALHVAQLQPAAYPQTAVLTMLGSKALADRALALENYYNAVGLPALVHGLKWAQPTLEKKLLADPRVTIYAGGRQDILKHRIDVRVIAVVEYLAQTYDQVTVSCLLTGHRLYARPGVISAHRYGRAVDISVVRNTPIAYHQQPGGITNSAINAILRLPPEMMPNQVISLLSLGGPSFALSNHWDHIHIGYAPALAIVPGTALSAQLPKGSVSLLHLWQAAGTAYGVPWQVLAAINKVESNFGQNMGPSSAGAVGWMQFLPSTWDRWAVDANGDGVANPSDAADAIFTAARYLAASGAGTNLPGAIFSYNHAQWYVNEVLQLASLFGGTSPGTFAALYAPSWLSDNDISPPMQHNLAMVPDPPTQTFGLTALGMDDEVQGLPMMAHPLLATGVSMLTDLLGTAQRALPQATSTVDLQARALAFHTMTGEPEQAYNVGVRQSLADPSVLARLPKVVLPLSLLRGKTQAASAPVTPTLVAPPSSSTGTP